MGVVDKETLDDVDREIESLTSMKDGDPYTNMNGDECIETIVSPTNVTVVDDTSNKVFDDRQLQTNFIPNKKQPPSFAL